jgi:hypothetical protein
MSTIEIPTLPAPPTDDLLLPFEQKNFTEEYSNATASRGGNHTDHGEISPRNTNLPRREDGNDQDAQS